MTPKRRFAVGTECRHLLDEACARRLPVTLTNKEADNWQVYKAHFLCRRGDRLLTSQPTPDTAPCHLEPAPGQVVAMSFKKGYNKCVFVTTIIRPENIELTPGEYTPALAVRLPQQIEKIQRRAFNRATVPVDLEVPVTMVPVEETDRPETLFGRLENLSAGGLGVIMSKNDGDKLTVGRQFLIRFIPLPQQQPLEVQARLRHVVPAAQPDRVMTGWQILGLEMTDEGRRRLRRIGRIVGVYERHQPLSRHTDLHPY